ncbi:adenylate/guanylate cyclase domain-containing protein [Aestuariivita boseongensis]|uniref:adenylate/guanylate cyclase domain-containing protein n=1 Tax=Aestuariivita boseongensis TaxID=1470562 RepID=UPI0006814F4C|nr:adenylate/guanylate cyclase domain-containing protein [Aestuariivita boseongensis]
MQRPKTHYAKAGDIHIAYQVFGDGPIDLLWAQGWATHIEYAWESPDYARFLTKLSRFARVIFFDKRGVGMSDRDVGYPTLEERSQDINAVLDAVGSKKVAVFGNSEGGAISTVFAATFPDRVSHLVLNGSRACYKWHPDYPFGLKPDALQAEIDAFSDMSTEASEETSIDGAPSIADDPAAIEWLDTYFRYAASPRAMSKLAVMNYDIDYRGVLSSIQVPTLILHREGDRWCSTDHARYLAEHIPGSVLKIQPGEDHIVWYGDQDELIGEIQSFLTGETSSRTVDRALKTVAFVDIVGSTEHLARMGDDRWRSVLEQLDHFVSKRLNSYDGKQVKHTGDGYLLSFQGPTSAIECLSALQADAARLGLQTRTGLHTGECEVRGNDLSGLAVNVAARIMDLAQPGQILASQTVKDLSLGADFPFEALPAHQLRGVPGDWPLFALD